ncbi:MAG TPA: c-type cytochrome domain-containing protein, partial [Candidatus Dormibacteraeota bacterium]|nr:c-type cytochrome domain-containing protein [Candidatus Dormibacteraeota bacterium]
MNVPNSSSARLALGLACLLTASVRDARAADAFWNSHVEPLLKEHCAECHNPTKTKSGLDVSSLQSMLRGGERGSAV